MQASSAPSAKLDEDKALQIHRLHAQGRGLRDLAEQFGVSMTTIQSVLKGKSWTEARRRFFKEQRES